MLLDKAEGFYAQDTDSLGGGETAVLSTNERRHHPVLAVAHEYSPCEGARDQTGGK